MTPSASTTKTERRGKPSGPSVPYAPATFLSVPAGELVVALDALGAEGQHLGADLLELHEVVGVGVELLGAHRRVVARVEHQDHGDSSVVGQGVALAARAGQRELRG